jgi:hypothetical protein
MAESTSRQDPSRPASAAHAHLLCLRVLSQPHRPPTTTARSTTASHSNSRMTLSMSACFNLARPMIKNPCRLHVDFAEAERRRFRGHATGEQVGLSFERIKINFPK